MAHVAGIAGARRDVRRAAAARRCARSDVVDRGFDGTTRRRRRRRRARCGSTVALPGRAQLMNVLAAVAVAIEFGVPRRRDRRRASRRCVPVARRGAIERARERRAARRRLVQREPGGRATRCSRRSRRRPTPAAASPCSARCSSSAHRAARLHAACGRAAAAAGVDELVVVGGPAADGLVGGRRCRGPAGAHASTGFATAPTAATAVAALVRPGDLVLVKGSRGTRTDVVADRLAEEAA